MMGGMGLGFGFFGLLLMLLFWGGLIVLAVWLVSRLFPRNGGQSMSFTNREASPREILDRRYARGEITREQYEAVKRDLELG